MTSRSSDQVGTGVSGTPARQSTVCSVVGKNQLVIVLRKLWAEVTKLRRRRAAEVATSEALPEAMREYLRAFESGDVSTLARFIAADVDHLQIGDDGDPRTEKAIIQGLGLDGVRAVIEGLHE